MFCPVRKNGNPEILLDYCARRLEPETMAAVMRHMSQCPECRQFAEAQEKIWSALDEWDAQPVSHTFDETLRERISEAERRRFWNRVLGERFSWTPALSFGAACATLAIVFVVSGPQNHPSSSLPDASVQPATQVETLEPEQIERSIEDLEMLRQFSTPARAVQGPA